MKRSGKQFLSLLLAFLMTLTLLSGCTDSAGQAVADQAKPKRMN